ncbi:MAG: DEAD/DEAH box helicase [Bacteroidales bacterium]|jgi:superfamily II DNA/RNA helicase|nr:DEAD/DEAH box helicase [Bacteroidales bacterium]
MNIEPKNLQSMLGKLGIEALNEMQNVAIDAITNNPEIVLLSPTGSGKTLAFLLPVIASLDLAIEQVQCLIVVPTRELAMQIEQVTRQLGSGIKVNAVYGGRAGYKDKVDLKHSPAILVGTPGRIADHLRRKNFETKYIQTLILDEFDKSLEIGFETEMREIVQTLEAVTKKVLTSATLKVDLPDFVGLKNPLSLDYRESGKPQLKIVTVNSPEKDKQQALFKLLCQLGDQPGIVFLNFKESIQRVSDFLNAKGIAHASFHGDMEQSEREIALVKFRNGSTRLLLATDLAARGIDVPEIRFIIHYHLPLKDHEFLHRNGRTARMFNDGTAYVLKWTAEKLPEFVISSETITPRNAAVPEPPAWLTIRMSGGRKDKISKADIAGLFIKQGKLKKDELGLIELKQDFAFIAVKAEKARNTINLLDNSKLKNTKIRLRLI